MNIYSTYIYDRTKNCINISEQIQKYMYTYIGYLSGLFIRTVSNVRSLRKLITPSVGLRIYVSHTSNKYHISRGRPPTGRYSSRNSANTYIQYRAAFR